MMERVQSDSETSTSERSVSFSTIEFHEHAMILGCSPSTTHGPPLEIDWMVMNSATIALDDYECLRPPRRPKEQLIMPEFVRQQVLMGNGYTMRQIRDHLQTMKTEKRGSESSVFKKLPLKILGKAKRSFSNILTAPKA